MPITYLAPDPQLDAGVFLSLVQRVWSGSYEPALIAAALKRTANITAWDDGRLVGCVRLLSDGYLFSTIPEILVDPVYQGQGHRAAAHGARPHAGAVIDLPRRPGWQ